LSTAAPAENGGDLSITAINTRRVRAGISVTELMSEARLNPKTWDVARAHPERTRRTTLERLDRALDRLVVGDRAPANRAAIGCLYELAVGVFAEKAGIDVAAALGVARDFAHERPQDDAWLACARVRRLAMYLVAGELNLGNAALGKVIGCTRQNVKQAVASVEALREEPAIDALIRAVTRLVPTTGGR
jgi:hypothetical protein